MTSREFRRAAWVIGVALVPLACGKGQENPSGTASASAAVSASAPAPATSTPPPETSSSAAAAASGSAAPAEKPKAVHRHGIAGEIFTRARALDLKDDQKEKLDKIDDELWSATAEDEDVKNALKDFGTNLIDGVKAGRVDAAKLQPDYVKLEEAAKKRHEAEAKALNDLHEMLDETQRKALVDALKKRHPNPADKAAQKPPAKPAKPPPPPDKTQAAERAKRRNARVTMLLGLDEPQSKRVEPILTRFDTEPMNKAHHQQVEKRMIALIAAFEKDDFDATKLDLGKGPQARMQNRVAFITTLLTILKADQRDKLARTIERPTSHRWGAAVVGEAGPAEED